MGNPRRLTATVVTDAAGAATAYLGGGGTPALNGRVNAIIYTADGTAPYAATVDFTITSEATGQSLWTEINITASKTVYPVAAANLGTGVASTILQVPIVLAEDRVKIVLAAGGDTKTGTFTLVME